jgi:hexosaminidase
MKKSMLTALSAGVLFLSVPGPGMASDDLPSPFVILPRPQNVVLLGGAGLEAGTLQHLLLKGEFSRPVMADILSRLTIVKTADKGTLTLILEKTISTLPSQEGYVLTVSRDRAEIKATAAAGLFYGCQSLEQLLEDARDYQQPVPACKITDYPALSYRAVHFDVKHHLDHMNYYYRSIDRLARYKINAVVFEFEDKLRYRRQALVGAPQAISIDEMAALSGYAGDRHIEITPLVQGLGHATFILKHEQYTDLRELPWNRWAFCPLDEGTYQVLFDLYRDAIDATPGAKYLHIGGDEIGNIGLCPRCKPTADKKGMFYLNLYWLKRVCAFAGENGRIPIFWDDMPLKYAGVVESTYRDGLPASEVAEAWAEGVPKLDKLLADFPKNCVYMRWNYSMARQEGNIRTLDWYQSRGLQAMVATATNQEGGFLFEADERDQGEASSGISIIKSFIGLAAEKHINGALCTAWDDKSPHMENYWRGFISAAEYSWSPNGRTLAEFDQAWLQREFGLTMPDYQDFRKQLRRGTVLYYEAYFREGNLLSDENALQSLVRLEHWLPPLEGREKVCFDYTAKLIDLPDRDNPGAWSRKYKERLEQAQSEVNNYQDLSAKLRGLYDSARRNRFYWQLALALYRFQITAPRVLLALKSCDRADKEQQKAGFGQVKQAMQEFEQAWSELKSVYSQTRFIAYPPGYVPDRYFHLASQREDLSWMIQAEELLFGRIEKWLQSQQ